MPDPYTHRLIVIGCLLVLLHAARVSALLTVIRYTRCLAALAAASTALDLLTHHLTLLTPFTALLAVWFTIDARQRHRRTVRLGDMAHHL